jgi:hypothetical protein
MTKGSETLRTSNHSDCSQGWPEVPFFLACWLRPDSKLGIKGRTTNILN